MSDDFWNIENILPSVISGGDDSASTDSSWWDSLGDIFGSSSDSSESSWMDDIFSVKNIGAGLSAYGASKSADDAKNTLLDTQEMKFQQEKDMAGINQANAIELLKLKQALGGDGGASNAANIAAATQKKIAGYQGRLGAREARMKYGQAAGDSLLEAFKTLIGAAQRPIAPR